MNAVWNILLQFCHNMTNSKGKEKHIKGTLGHPRHSAISEDICLYIIDSNEGGLIQIAYHVIA